MGQFKATGSTALGAALYLSTLFAGLQSSLGSQVILLTDGLANEGIGVLENNPYGADFYNSLAQIAKQLRVKVSIFSIGGSDVVLSAFQNLILESGGIIDELETTQVADVF